MNKPYAELAGLSYQNAIDLIDEAKILLKEKHYSRAYVLTIAALEELMKSLVFKGIWAGAVNPNELITRAGGKSRNTLRNHKAKHAWFSNILLLRQAYREDRDALLKYFKNPSAKSDKIPPKVDRVKAKEIAELFRTMEDDRQNCTYVGLVNEKERIVNPNKQVDAEKCGKLLAMVEDVLPFIEMVLKFEAKTIQNSLSLIASYAVP